MGAGEAVCCTHQNSPSKMVSICNVKGPISDWQGSGLKHKDPKPTTFFPAESVTPVPNIPETWAMNGKFEGRAVWGLSTRYFIQFKNGSIWVYVIEPRFRQREIQVIKFLFVKQQRNQKKITKIPFIYKIFWLKLEENCLSVYFSARSENQC